MASLGLNALAQEPIYHAVNIMAADASSTQGARASPAMTLT